MPALPIPHNAVGHAPSSAFYMRTVLHALAGGELDKVIEFRLGGWGNWCKKTYLDALPVERVYSHIGTQSADIGDIQWSSLKKSASDPK